MHVNFECINFSFLGFEVTNIVQILSISPAFGIVADNWNKLAVFWGINSIRIYNWQQSLVLNTLKIEMVLSKMLEERVAKTGKVKISVLIENLESVGMNDMANKLREELSNKYPNANPNGVSINIAGSVLQNTPGSISTEHSSINCQVECEGLLPQINSSESPNQQSTNDIPKNKKKSKLRCWILIFILLIVFFTSFAIYFGVFYNSDSKPQSVLTNSSSQRECINDNVEEREEMFPIDVTSYSLYQNLVNQVPDNQPISLDITLNGKGQWPHDVVLQKPCSIKELNITGFVDFSFLSWILNQTTEVESVNLEITSRAGCDENDTQISVTNLDQDYVSALPNLLTLTLSHSCANTWMYKFLSHIKMLNLETFKVINGIINEVNIKYLRTILKQSKRLKIFHLISKLGTGQLFNRIGNEATSLQEVRIDNITGTSQKSEHSRLILGVDFCDTLPDLKVFQSTNSCIAFNDRYLVFMCLSLKKLTLSICYTGDKYYRLGIVQQLSHLEEIDFYLVFPDDNCPPRNDLNRVREEVNNSTVKAIKVCSNCIIHSTRESYCVT